jgi:hypothetical protein
LAASKDAYSSWTIAGDSGSSTVSSGETATIAGGNYITTSESGRTVTLDVEDHWYDSVADIPTATPSDGDTTHLSTADHIYDFVTGQGYLTSESDTLDTVSDRGATTDKALTIDSNGDEQTNIGGTLYVNGSSHGDRVGVNTTTPTDTLDVDGNIQVSGVIHSGGDVIIRLGS